MPTRASRQEASGSDHEPRAARSPAPPLTDLIERVERELLPALRVESVDPRDPVVPRHVPAPWHVPGARHPRHRPGARPRAGARAAPARRAWPQRDDARGRGHVVDVSDFLEREACSKWSDLRRGYYRVYRPFLMPLRLRVPYAVLDLARAGYRLVRRVSPLRP